VAFQGREGGEILKANQHRKSLELKNGTEVSLRRMRRSDFDRSLAFFQALPESVRGYLRGDVSQPGFVAKRILDMEAGRVYRLVALDGDAIVGDGALELSGHEWESHIGELRLIIAVDFQRQGLGTMMARELYGLANQEKLDEIVVRMMKPSETVRRIFRRFGFHDEVLMPGFVRDIYGKPQDIILMRCELSELWKKMEDYLDDCDWQHRR